MRSLDLDLPAPEAVLAGLSAVAAQHHCGPESVEFELPGLDCQAVLDPFNRRLKVYELSAGDLSSSLPSTSSRLEELVIGKVTAYALPGENEAWEEMGFRQEAVIRGFYPESVDAHLWAAYPNPDRLCSDKEGVHQAGVVIAESKPVLAKRELLPGYECRVAQPTDAAEIAGLMSMVFPVYPTPIDESVIEEQIRTHANHFRMVTDPTGDTVAVASAEIDHQRSSAEMTDCATRPDCRGRGLMVHILAELEADLARLFDLTDLYTIARADEIAMNCVFSKLGYDFTGRLVNNCRMPNGWESMNVWCRSSLSA
jgi:putative beta-lysine N-acetyltransferase